MKWFEGSISDAVITSKRENAVFVVFIEGKDEASKIMLSAVNKPNLSHHLESKSFVSIKLESGSESHTQFTEIYKLVPVPSVFFIGQNGAPLEIVAGENSEEIVTTKLEAAVKKCIGPVEPSSENCVQENPSPSSSHQNFPSDGSKQNETPTVPGPSDSTPQESGSATTDEAVGNRPASPAQESPQPSPQPTSNTEKLSKEQLVEIIEKKKEARKAEEEREEKEREIKRRKVGQSMMEAKRKQQEMEVENVRMELRKEKELEKEAKQRVLDQIARDRAERLARTSPPAAPSAPPVAPTAPPPADANSARIQFKLPDGQTKTHTFPAETTLGQMRQFIDNNIVLPFREYQLATTFPRREFTHRDIQTDLRELQLLPTAVVLIMPLQGNMSVTSSGTNWPKTIMDMLWDLMQPLVTFSKYLQSLVFGRGSGGEGGQQPPPQPSTSNPSAPRSAPPPSRVVRRRGNIHSLADNDNSNDENNTWNGNSTQQM